MLYLHHPAIVLNSAQIYENSYKRAGKFFPVAMTMCMAFRSARCTLKLTAVNGCATLAHTGCTCKQHTDCQADNHEGSLAAQFLPH
jgi:hypothetical protein